MKVRKDLMSKEFPSIWIEVNDTQNSHILMAGFYRQWTHENIIGKGQKLQSTFYSDAAGMWNMAPDSVKNSKTLYSAKREIKKFILTLPIKS